MSDFTEYWLALREPYDARARNPNVLAGVAESVAHRGSISIVDLACGTGAMLRAISSRLPMNQDWRLVDHNLRALSHAEAMAGSPGVKVRTTQLDLVDSLRVALDGPYHIVTASAFLDLVSQEWLERLVSQTVARQLLVYATLTYDGRVELTPSDRLDAAVIAAVNRHQLGDKGFGPALGPNASAWAIRRFQAAGYQVLHGQSDWTFAPVDREIQVAIFAAWAHAAKETGEVPIVDLSLWLTARREAVADGRSHLCVGHVDFFARPVAMTCA